MTRLVLLLVFVAGPVVAGPGCDRSEQQAMSCAEGLVWDPETDTCLPIVTG